MTATARPKFKKLGRNPLSIGVKFDAPLPAAPLERVRMSKHQRKIRERSAVKSTADKYISRDGQPVKGGRV